MSGLSDSYDEAMLKRVRENPRHKETTIQVPTKPLTAILDEAGIAHPDFISLDIEGGELSALQSFPFADHMVGMWSIENNTGGREIADLMKSHNYDLIDFCGGGHGHHGGAWKVAYADFVTAMMAFFMLMWLLNATSEQQRAGLADYFTPTITINRSSGGGDGMFGGDSVSSQDSF